MAHKFQTIQDYNWELDGLIVELLLALSACKGAHEEELQLRHAGEPLGEYVSLPGSGNQAFYQPFGDAGFSDFDDAIFNWI